MVNNRRCPPLHRPRRRPRPNPFPTHEPLERIDAPFHQNKMDYLWTPWRYQYVTQADAPGVCVFCAAAQSADDAKTLVVYRGEQNMVILNRYPYCSGHVMVVPYTHVASLAELPDEGAHRDGPPRAPI